MKVVVTGAAGHVGANLVRALMERGDDVVALVHSDRRGIEGTGANEVSGDLADIASLRAAFDGAEVVFHTAAHVSITGSDGGRTESTNVDGAANAAQAALDAGVRRFVHFSSVHAFHHEAGGEVSEASPRADERPKSAAYDRSKVGGERAVRQAIERGLDAVVVNPAAVLGPHDYKPSRMGEVLLRLFHRKLPGLIKGGFDWVDVRDVCAGAMAAADRGATGHNYILSGHWHSLQDLAAVFQRVSGVPAPKFVSPIWLARTGLPVSSIWSAVTKSRPLFTSESLDTVARGARCCHDKATAELGYSPRPLDETLRDTLAWFDSMNLLSNAKAKAKAKPAMPNR